MLRGGMALAKDAFIEVMLPDDVVAWPWRRVRWMMRFIGGWEEAMR